MIANFISVVMGAAIGAALRYAAVLTLPSAVLWVNILGSLIIGYVYPKLIVTHPQMAPFLTIGLLGSLTTFSSFSLEVLESLNQGMFFKALAYILVSVIGCVAACYLGYRLAV